MAELEVSNNKPQMENYKILRDEQARLENHRMNVLISSVSISSLAALLSLFSKNEISPFLLFLIFLITMIWGLSMYKSLSSQIMKTITYNMLYHEKEANTSWLRDSIGFVQKNPPLKKWLKQFTHIFTMMMIASVIMATNQIYLDIYKLNAWSLNSLKYILILVLIIIEFILWFQAVIKYDQYLKYIDLWQQQKSLKSEPIIDSTQPKNQ